MPTPRILLLAIVALGLAPALHGDGTSDRVKADLFYLAGEECEGRGLKTDGINKAAAHVAAAFKAAGLKSAVADGSYFQPFGIKESYLEAGPHKLAFAGPDAKAIDLSFGKEFTVCGTSGKGTVGGGVVFVGFGISAPKKYDDYDGLEVKNKIVVVLRQTPRVRAKTDRLFTEEEVGQYAPLTAKIALAVKRGAAGVVFVNDRDMAGTDDPLMTFDYARDDGKPGTVPVVHAKRSAIDRLFAGQNKKLADVEADIDRTLKPQSFEIPDWTAELQASIAIREIKAKNVVGYLEGTGPLAAETVVVGAHYDHLGRGEKGTRSIGTTAIHYGADDNASGTTGLIELARRFAASPNRAGRRIVFIAFSGEERGLFGSLYYCDKPLFPLKDTVAMLNMDMIGRVRPDEKSKQDRLLVGGVGSAKSFEKLLDDTNAAFQFKVEKSKSGTGPSDHTSFYLAKVPVYFFFSGDHAEYHTPKDTPDTINLVGLKKVVDMVETMTAAIATATDRPEYVAGVGGSMSGGAGGGPKLGLMPRYDDAETKGMEVGGVVPGGAAETAGLLKGDRITAIDGKPVKNVQDYMKVMAGLKRGEETTVTVDRDGKELKLKAKPK